MSSGKPTGDSERVSRNDNSITDRKRKRSNNQNPTDDITLTRSVHQAQLRNYDIVIWNVHDHDILLGRGGRNNQHRGNELLRQIARQHAASYTISSKSQKTEITQRILHHVRNRWSPPARFLKKREGGVTTGWVEVNDIVAREKVGQVLRDAVVFLDNQFPEDLLQLENKHDDFDDNNDDKDLSDVDEHETHSTAPTNTRADATSTDADTPVARLDRSSNDYDSAIYGTASIQEFYAHDHNYLMYHRHDPPSHVAMTPYDLRHPYSYHSSRNDKDYNDSANTSYHVTPLSPPSLYRYQGQLHHHSYYYQHSNDSEALPREFFRYPSSSLPSSYPLSGGLEETHNVPESSLSSPSPNQHYYYSPFYYASSPRTMSSYYPYSSYYDSREESVPATESNNTDVWYDSVDNETRQRLEKFDNNESPATATIPLNIPSSLENAVSSLTPKQPPRHVKHDATKQKRRRKKSHKRKRYDSDDNSYQTSSSNFSTSPIPLPSLPWKQDKEDHNDISLLQQDLVQSPPRGSPIENNYSNHNGNPERGP